MSFVQREITRLNMELATAPQGPRYAALYAAQQALAWSLDPSAFRAPYDSVMGIPADSEDCLAESHPAGSLGISAPSGLPPRPTPTFPRQ